MWHCRFLLTALGKWRLTCYAPKPVAPISFHIPEMLSTIQFNDNTGGKTPCCQQNGYFVLRFLAEDVGKCLDHVLDTVVAALVHRENSKSREWICPSMTQS